ncbi:nitric oxide reductase transcriptional regulator NorR [Rheinheimera sp. F8]|uniref:nitric oxide reductase transcriptional regulator NorR n=1 Tax=Rheinheimera sp. F8 TaxID=1763998 RepID=UPI000744A716|nr:nitric oxide reductase transcriptional regulator NorR [Rheinheimera sp. F8]ALZ74580.1 transcriptional regulator [Rheinheimera sp. F8]
MNSDNHLLLEVALDLANSINTEDRFDRLLSSIRKAIRCDAVALLRLQQQVLIPLAIQGLAADTLGRRFLLSEHPRLAALCRAEGVYRFPADCPLPDPYDGLLLAHSGELPVHSCMGLPLYSDGQLMGLVTIDSMQPGAFQSISDRTLALIAALSAATLKTALELAKLSMHAHQARQLVEELTQEALLKDGGELIGHSGAMQALQQDINLVAGSDYTVLILGESGVGKELVARTVHKKSARHRGPLVHLNCAALPETLADAELFGHARGAFTGAERERPGKFLLADGGTIFLDEIGELPLSIQSKLLRVLQSGEIQPVGKDQVQQVNVRIIAATNRDLQQEVQQGRFRADLYHRLSVYPLTVPPLRQRPDDILLLAGYFIEQTRRKLGLRQLKLAPAAAQALQAAAWPGNVRELEHVVSRAALKASGREGRHGILTMLAEDLALTSAAMPVISASDEIVASQPLTDLKTATEAFQRQLIQQMLAQTNCNWAEAARRLQLDRANLMRLAKRLGISTGRVIQTNKSG